jgi:hypothetical protein
MGYGVFFANYWLESQTHHRETACHLSGRPRQPPMKKLQRQYHDADSQNLPLQFNDAKAKSRVFKFNVHDETSTLYEIPRILIVVYPVAVGAPAVYVDPRFKSNPSST